MKNFLKFILVSFDLCCLVNATAYAKPIVIEPSKILITIINSEASKKECDGVSSALTTIIKTEKRFNPKTSGSAPYKLEISCSPSKLTGKFYYTDPAGILIPAVNQAAAIDSPTSYQDPNTALDLWTKIIDKLPWAAETLNLKQGTQPADMDPNPGELQLQAIGSITLGLNTNALLGSCVPIEIGRPVTKKSKEKNDELEFQSISYGVIREVETYQSKIEAYAKTKVFDFKKNYIIRLANPSQLPVGMPEIIKYCQTHPAGLPPAKVTDLLSSVFGKDSVEVNNIIQRYGLGLFTSTGANGEKAPLLGAGYVHNRLLFGQFFIIDAFGVRSIYSKPYTKYGARTNTVKPELTNAEIFVGGRAKFGNVNTFIGTGLVIEKINTPYLFRIEEGTKNEIINQRVSSARFGLLLGGNFSLNRINYGLRVPIAQSQGKLVINAHNYFTYRLSSTWLTGMDFMFLSSQPREPKAPNTTTVGLGGFLGIEIGR